MRYDGTTATVKSIAPFFDLERTGAKPNTLRIVPTDELLAVGRCTRLRVVEVDERGVATTKCFERTISGAFDITPAMKASGVRGVYARHYIVICWDPREG